MSLKARRGLPTLEGGGTGATEGLNDRFIVSLHTSDTDSLPEMSISASDLFNLEKPTPPVANASTSGESPVRDW